ncbi:hypothetical protein PVK64_10020 [Aliivibrio sp. S4TY2]|uniref:hypothetical protein n=1 Tax=unclassified Aliivibrio TaxID=2645654 RepID=UPI0023790C53|nr:MULTISPECIES: hypothetical protein [unclassified Aliivibrio]MDD9156524.1 hypothetical protein [Aliivibrio sp. S4TY2]MDD9160039.1 hypothetical protein [Aliivibrio sp. S4TY1]MDD9164261.1 hypothetical protein [Aliivibrio sp. S4MY2]MDD9168231.1 hypothetical protein [Aliivibrio sp. S4MY4]MDD9184567.1 hypothetical protein [Aliivibrio sp. S4MY3]
MKTISIICSAMMLCSSAIAGIDLSIEKDVVEVGVTAAVTKNTYLYIGGDNDNWVGLGIGYHQFVNQNWKLASYYEYGLKDDWLMSEVAGIDGVKTKTHFIELSATRFFDGYSTKVGMTTEFVRNGFTWITVDNANKYSGYVSAAKYFQHAYITSKYEFHYAEDRSDMLDFNQGQASELEFSIGTMRPVWHIYPYAKISAFTPHDTYYGMTETEYSWNVGGRLSF